MFEDEEEDDDLELSELELWYDDNLQYFNYKENEISGPTVETELFYYSVYVPFKKDLKKPLREMLNRHYSHIATELRPEVLTRIENDLDWVGHEFILFLHNMVQFWKTGKDLREIFPELDKWAVSYRSYRRPRYLEESFWDQMNWLTDEQKQSLKEESNSESDEAFAYEEKPRFEFFDLLQRITFKYYKELQELDADGWTMFEVFLTDEYTNYELDFEHYDSFIEYEFDVEDLDLPYAEYNAKFSAKCKERLDEELSKKQDEVENKE